MLFVLLFESFCISFYYFPYRVQFMLRKPRVFCKLNLRFKPKLCLLPFMDNMNMHSLFFIGEDFENIAAFSAKNRAHLLYFDAKIDNICKMTTHKKTFS